MKPYEERYEEGRVYHVMLLIMVVSILSLLTYDFLKLTLKDLLLTYVLFTVLYMIFSLMYALTAVNLKHFSSLKGKEYIELLHKSTHESTVFADTVIFCSFNYIMLCILTYYLHLNIVISLVLVVSVSPILPLYLIKIFKEYYNKKELQLQKHIGYLILALIVFLSIAFSLLFIRLHYTIHICGICLYLLTFIERKYVVR